MKKFKVILFALLSVLVGAVCSSCDGEKDKDQEPHLEMGPVKFKTAIDYRIEKNENYIIVDYRSKEQYDAGHVPGSVWIMEGTVQNMDDDSFAREILKRCNNDKTYYVFMVGGASTGLQMTMGGSVSGVGFGKNHSIVLAGGFPVWKKQNEEDPNNFPIEKTE